MGDVRMSDDLRDRVTEALTCEHYRRAHERIAASPEEHSTAMADVAMGVLTAQDVGEPCAQIAQTAVVRPGDTLIIRVDPRSVHADVDRMLSKARAALPGVEVLVVGAEGMAIYRPEPRYEFAVGANVTQEQAARFADELARQQATSSLRGDR